MRLLAAVIVALFAVLGSPGWAAERGELARWEQRAARVVIKRDDWGIAHIRGRSDADAVFGMIYAQAEDDFPRVEANYVTALGRAAEAEGEAAIWRDLRQKLFIDPADLQRRHAGAPRWLKALTTAWADGLNYYLHTHPQVRPRVITRFEPWMALAFSEGSIGGDIERVSLSGLEAFYGGRTAPALAALADEEPRGSNGIAIGPGKSVSGNALLLINPHTSFFFRSEQQVTSDEGLNAYGAATWGQFFVYQGFNDRVGWMHTTSGLDVVDEYVETIVERDGERLFRQGGRLRPVARRVVDVPYRKADGTMASRRFTTYRTHHGPIVRSEGGRWVSVALMHRPVEALSQSFLRTKARSFRQFERASRFQANSSNNTIYADADGVTAYLHPQFIPRRDDRFDWTRPVDGSDPATDWGPLHPPAEAPRVVSLRAGWIQNTNNAPWSAAGPHSPSAARFPRYMDTVGENPRGQHAVALLQGGERFTLEGLRAAAYDSRQPAFERLIPPLVAAFDALPAGDPLRSRLSEPIGELRGWDGRWSTTSTANTLAMVWGEVMWRWASAPERADGSNVYDRIDRAPPARKLEALNEAVGQLERDFGRWRTPWGEVNRFQRLTGDIVHSFSDAGASLPVGFSSARWGSLASFGAQPRGGSKRWYGTSGNSFVAVVEFGPRVRAVAVSAGGQSGDPASPHFNDQAARYATGHLRPVYYYEDELAGHVERRYRPGEQTLTGQLSRK